MNSNDELNFFFFECVDESERGCAASMGVAGSNNMFYGRQVIFVENKNTDRLLRNANYGKEHIFVANKDTNREALPSSRHVILF